MGVGGRPRHCSCPFTVSVSEAALTRTSAIRLPPSLGPETRGGGGEGRGAGPVGAETPPGRGRRKGAWLPKTALSPGQNLKGCFYNEGRGGQQALWVSLSHQKGTKAGGGFWNGPKKECHPDVRRQGYGECGGSERMWAARG